MIRRLRLLSGLVMLAYVTMHLLNHAVGLISLKAMEDVLWYVFRIWTNRPAQALLYGSFLIHYALALSALWQRRTLRLRFAEAAQLVFGFAIPLLLVRHVVGTRISDSFFHTDIGYYAYLLWIYFVRSPDHGYLQMLVLVVAWAHAMIGLHFWFRVRPWYGRLQPPALIVAVLVPVLSLLGMVEAGRQVAALAADPDWIGKAFANMRLPSPETARVLEQITDGADLGLRRGGGGGAARADWSAGLGSADAASCASAIRTAASSRSSPAPACSRRAGSPASRMPHVCGGRGRCSTCRVRVRGELHSLDPPGEDELRVLRRIGATSNVRLACQLRPHGAVERYATVAAFCSCFGRTAPGRFCAGQRARNRHPVRRHPRLHQPRRRAAAL